MNFKNILIHIHKKEPHLVRFLIVGLSGVFVNMCFLFIFKEFLNMALIYAGVISIEISILSNFYFNNLWTFKNKKNQSLFQRAIKYHFSVLIGSLINYVLLLILSNFLWYILANLIGIFFATLSNYLLSSRWAWK